LVFPEASLSLRADIFYSLGSGDDSSLDLQQYFLYSPQMGKYTNFCCPSLFFMRKQKNNLGFWRNLPEAAKFLSRKERCTKSCSKLGFFQESENVKKNCSSSK